jgi:hypothetical protein
VPSSPARRHVQHFPYANEMPLTAISWEQAVSRSTTLRLMSVLGKYPDHTRYPLKWMLIALERTKETTALLRPGEPVGSSTLDGKFLRGPIWRPKREILSSFQRQNFSDRTASSNPPWSAS